MNGIRFDKNPNADENTCAPQRHRDRARGFGGGGQGGSGRHSAGERASVFRGSATNRTMQFGHYRGRQANRNSTAAERSHFKIKADRAQAGGFRDVPSTP